MDKDENKKCNLTNTGRTNRNKLIDKQVVESTKNTFRRSLKVDK